MGGGTQVIYWERRKARRTDEEVPSKMARKPQKQGAGNERKEMPVGTEDTQSRKAKTRTGGENFSGKKNKA